MKRYIHTQQIFNNDCAVACIYSIFSFYCYYVDYDIIINQLNINNIDSGISIKTISEYLSKHNFINKVYKCNKDLSLLKNIPKPFIAQVLINNNYHYIVVYGNKNNSFIISDPSKDKLSNIELNSFCDIFTGICIVIDKPINLPHTRKANRINGLFKCLKLIFSKKLLIIPNLILALFITIISVFLSLYFKVIIDFVLPNKLENELAIISLIFIGATILNQFLLFLKNFTSILIQKNIQKILTKKYIEKIINLPFRLSCFYSEGDLFSRLQDVDIISNILGKFSCNVFVDVIMIAITGRFLFLQNNILFNVSIFCILLLLIISTVSFKKINQLSDIYLKKNSYSIENNIDLLENIDKFKIINKLNYFKIKTLNANFEKINTFNNLDKFFNILEFLKSGIKNIYLIFIIWLGMQQIINGVATIGEILSFNALLIYFLTSFEELFNLIPLYQKANSAIRRFYTIMSLQSSKDGNICISKINEVNIKNVSVNYFNNNIISDVNINIKKSDKILIYGENGCGKTTFCKALINMIDYSGSILINNENLKNIKMSSLIENILYISNESPIIKGTLRDNLILGNDKLDENNIINICKNTGLYNFISNLNLKFDFILDKDGKNVSQGQRQLILITRAILMKPDLLIIDEALSHVDSKLKQNILTYISENLSSIIFVSHNLEDFIDFNKIYYISKGKFKEIKGVVNNEDPKI